jgi:DNA-binding NarL/FixJ family response regulator
MAPFIVVVEDDHLQDGPLRELLQEQFPAARIDAVRTEKDFRGRLDDYRRDRPDVVVMDVMMRWADPRPGDPPPPPDVLAGGYRRAGIRCADLMARDPALCDVPVIYYTILERSDLERDTEALAGNVFLIRKSSDRQPLTRKVRELTASARRRRSRRPETG